MQSSINPKIKIHYHWLSGISFVMGYLWFISGLNKVLGGNFPEKFVHFAKTDFLKPDAYEWYVSFYNTLILPHSFFFGQLIQWSEITFGLLFFLGSLWLLFSDSKFSHIIIAFASIGSLIFILNILFSVGEIVPWINTKNAFEEGVNTDGLALIISLILLIGNAWELGKDWILKKNSFDVK